MSEFWLFIFPLVLLVVTAVASTWRWWERHRVRRRRLEEVQQLRELSRTAATGGKHLATPRLEVDLTEDEISVLLTEPESAGRHQRTVPLRESPD